MSTRDPKQIQQEYGTLCAQSGEKNYQILVLQEELRRINITIQELNKEMGEIMKAKATADIAAATPVVETVTTAEVSNEQSSSAN